MKRMISVAMLAIAVMFASCNKEDLALSGKDTQLVTFTVSTDGVHSVSTKAEPIALTRYVMEIYTDAACTNPALVFDNAGTPSHHRVQTTAVFELLLSSKNTYTCLFWADDDDFSGAVSDNGKTFTTTSLLSVSQHSNLEAIGTWNGRFAEGFSGKETLTGATPSVTVTLNRAVSKVEFKETDVIKAGSTLEVTFTNKRHLNINTGAVATGEAPRTLKFPTFDTEVKGTELAPVTIGSFFVLSSKDGDANVDMTSTLKLSGTPDQVKTIPNVPLKANYITSIKGQFSNLKDVNFTVEASDVWEGVLPFVNPATHTVELMEAGTLTPAVITQAMDGGTELKIAGTMNDQDFYTLRNWAVFATSLVTLDLSGATGLTAIPDKAFYDHISGAWRAVTTLQSITLPSSVTTIGNQAFENCSALSSINLDNIVTIGGRAFYNCDAITSITAPKLESVDVQAFQSCNSLASFIAPNLTSIGNGTFHNCPLTTLKLTSSDPIWIHTDNFQDPHLITLTLNSNKAGDVTNSGKDWAGRTWAAIILE